MAFICRSGLLLPRAQLARGSRAAFRGIALRQHEQGALLQLGRLIAVQKFFEHRQGTLRIAVHQAVEGHQLEIFVGLGVGIDLLAGSLLHLQLERLGIVHPAAARIGLAQVAEGGQGFLDAGPACSARRPSSRAHHRRAARLRRRPRQKPGRLRPSGARRWRFRPCRRGDRHRGRRASGPGNRLAQLCASCAWSSPAGASAMAIVIHNRNLIHFVFPIDSSGPDQP